MLEALSRIGSGLADFLGNLGGGKSQIDPFTQATSGSAIKQAVFKAINQGQKTGLATTPGELGKDTFLQLLVRQMQYQDPLAPMDNTEMIAQLAQFSALEQMNNLNEQFAEFSGNVDQLNFMTATSMIGKYVSGVGADGQPISGVVDGVQMVGSVVYLTIGERQLSMAGVFTIASQPPAEE